MTKVAQTSKFQNLIMAMLIICSTLHILIFRVEGFINIMFIDFLIFFAFFLLVSKIITIPLNNISITLFFLLVFQLLHNIIYSADLAYSIKELIQASEIFIFFLILSSGFLFHNDTKKILEYTFYGLCIICIMSISKYFFEFMPGIFYYGGGPPVSEYTFKSYIKPSSIINQIIPVFILSFYLFSKSSLSAYKLIIFVIIIFSLWLGIHGNSRTFEMFLLLIVLDYLFNLKRLFLLISTAFVALVFIAIFQNEIVYKYNSDYKEKTIATYDYITNDEPFYYEGHEQLMIIESPSNRERLHFLKLSYQTITQNLLFGLGSQKVQHLTNLHGNLFVYLNSFGLIYLISFLYLILNLFFDSRKQLNKNNTSFFWMQHYYLLYAIASMLFVSAGSFPFFPLIIAAALIKSNKNHLLE